MLETVTIVVGVLLLLVLLGGVALWLRIAAADMSDSPERRKSPDITDPMFLRGNELFDWAKNTAARIVAKHLRGVPAQTTPIDLAREVHEATTCGMLPLGSPPDDVCAIPCPEKGQGLIGVTAPEAIEIADYIQRTLPPAERDRIYVLARENAKRLANMTLSRSDIPQLRCPLQGSDGVCLAYTARPLRCRPIHAATIWQQRGLNRHVDEVNDYDEQIVEQGAEAGLTEALVEGGRDGDFYELNAALVTALETPNAAKRWADGEDVFKSCKRYV